MDDFRHTPEEEGRADRFRRTASNDRGRAALPNVDLVKVGRVPPAQPGPPVSSSAVYLDRDVVHLD
jgi:hypothetical protein